MTRYTPGKIVAVLLLCVLSALYAAPSALSPETRKSIEDSIPSWIPKWIVPHRAIVLGLDLQGGSHILLEVDAPDLMRAQVATLRDDVRRILREVRVTPQGGIGTLPRGVQLRVPEQADRDRLIPRLQEITQPVGGLAALGVTGASAAALTQGEGGLIQIQLTEAGMNDRVRRAVEQAIEVLRRRVDSTGTTEPSIQRQGANRIEVQVPGLQHPERLKELLGRTAKLEFRMVAEPGAVDVDSLPSRDNPGQTLPVERRVIVDGSALVDAQPSFDQQSGRPVVNFRFNVAGGQRFGQVTSESVGRALAIVLDNEVISAPTIQSPITGGSGIITGQFTVQQVNELAVLLRAGALPAKLTVIEERTVGPGLGADSIRAGTLATYVAGAFVVVFMLVSYGVFGLIANIALAVHLVLIFALMSLTGATLTLPGIAGIVLTIGTAVDSNVLIYERIREEAKAGRSILMAIDAGFQRAFATVFDSNSTMLIAAVILFFMGAGPVRGFAVVFIFGIVTTLITAITMTRMMINLWYRLFKPTRIPF